MEQRRVRFKAGDIEITAVLNDSPTADLVWEALPIEGDGGNPGFELYVRTPIKAVEAEDATDLLEMGAFAYSPPWQTLCVFYAPTAASRGDEIRTEEPVNVVGRMEGDPGVLKNVEFDTRVVVERA